MARDFLICLSLANLWFLGTWYTLQKLSSPKLYYFRKEPPDMGLTAATALVVLAVAAMGFLFARFVRRNGSPVAFSAGRFLFLAGCLLAAEGVRAYVETRPAGSILLGAEIIVLALAVFWSRVPARVAMMAVLMLWPLYPLIVGYQLFTHLTAGTFEDQRPTAVKQNLANNKVRSIWLIFDEFDQCVAFERRPAHLQLKNLDRLRQTAVYAPHATPPGPKTIMSIPGFLIGDRVREAHSAGSDRLTLTLQDGSQRPAWRGTPNLFSKARDMGLRVGIVGWYHPYCRVAGASADFCTWEEYAFLSPGYPWELRARPLNLHQRAWLVCGRQLRAYPTMRRLGLAPAPAGWFSSNDEYGRQASIETFRRVREAAQDAITDASLDFVFVHWPIPHLPGLFTHADKKASGYLDNLALTDATLGEIRELLEERGLWDRTLLLVSSDHSFRPQSWYDSPFWTTEDRKAFGDEHCPFVPFLFKLPEQETGVIFEKTVDLSVAADLTLGVLNGRLKEPDDVTRWLDRALYAAPQRGSAGPGMSVGPLAAPR